MADIASQPRIVTEPEREARTRLRQLIEAVHARAYRARDLRELAARLRERLDRLNQLHPEYWKANTRSIINWWIAVAAYVGVWMADILLSAPSSTFYATKYAHAGPRGVLFAIIILPTIVFLIEMMLSNGRIAAAERAVVGLPLGYYGCVAGGLVLVIVMPMLIASTQLAVAAVSAGGLGAYASKLRVIAVTATAVVLHAVVAFSPRVVHDAKGFLLYRLKASPLESGALRAKRGQSSAERAAVNLFGAYSRELGDWNGAHQDTPLRQEPLQRIAADLLLEHAGHPRSAPAGDGQSSDPSAVRPDGSDGPPPAAAAASEVPPATAREPRRTEPAPGPEPDGRASEPRRTTEPDIEAEARVRDAEAEVVA